MEFEKYPEYRRNTVYYFVGEGMDEMLLLAPPDFPCSRAIHLCRFPDCLQPPETGCRCNSEAPSGKNFHSRKRRKVTWSLPGGAGCEDYENSWDLRIPASEWPEASIGRGIANLDSPAVLKIPTAGVRLDIFKGFDRTFTILVADDLPENLVLIRDILNRRAAACFWPERQGALEMAFQHHPDLVLLDVMMPAMDGYQVCHELKVHRDTQLIPVVMITALTDLGDKIRGLSPGADDFLNKPFNLAEFTAREVLLR
jgi:CheY-like chemotaxis protein